MVCGGGSQRSGPPAPPDRVSVPKISPLTHIARCPVSLALTFTFDLFDLYFISSGNVSNIERAAELPASAPLTVDSHLLEAGEPRTRESTAGTGGRDTTVAGEGRRRAEGDLGGSFTRPEDWPEGL